MKALLAGATGAIGSLLLAELCKDERFTEIVAITRRPLAIESPKLKELSIDSLDDLKAIKPIPNSNTSTNGNETHTHIATTGTEIDKAANLLANTDMLFCCLGTTIKTAGSQENFKKVDLEGVKILGALAERMQIKNFIMISAAGADKNSTLFYNRVKGEAEEDLLKRNIDSITIFRPGLLLTERKEFRFGEFLAIKAINLLKKLIPNRLTASFATDAHALVQSMLANSLLTGKGEHIIEASQINPNPSL
jgi:uncharacterized protein YbjT (DUF2867 family)